jgi:imidazolonepropionase-like amidohydrolase
MKRLLLGTPFARTAGLFFLLSFLLLALRLSLASGQEKPIAKTIKAVRFGKLWDGKGKVWTNAVVLVEGDRIKTVTAVEVFLARKGALRTLEAGVTTVRDLGADQYMDIAMRDLINRGEMAGPRMFVCGYGLYVTNTPYKPGLNLPGGGIADGVPEVLRVVRQQIAAGADVIKMYASTGTDDDTTGFQTYTYEEIKAAVDMAHQFGKKIAIHSYGPDGARDAVRAGTDSLEHATDMDDATITEMVKRGTFYVPTIDHNRYYLDNWQKIGYANGFQEKTKAFIARNLETARKAHKAGVKFAMGSDAIYTMFGENTRELGWFVKAGMTPEEALRTATTNAAELLGKEKELGAVAPGYFADLVAVDGDPLVDINVAINKVRWVMKAGAVVADKTTVQPH